VSRPRAGRSPLAWAKGAREVSEPLPLPAGVNVQALQGDGSSLQVTEEEAPQPRLYGDPVDHEERRSGTGWADHNRSRHDSEGRIDANHSLEVSGREGGEFGDGAFPEDASAGCGAEQRQDAKIKQGPQDQRRAQRDPPPMGPGAGRLQRPAAFRLESGRLDGRGVRHEILEWRDQASWETRTREGRRSTMTLKIPRKYPHPDPDSV